MPKDEKLESIKNELEKSKEEKNAVKTKKEEEKEPEANITAPNQPVKGRWLIWGLLFGMVFSFIAAFISIILRAHGVI